MTFLEYDNFVDDVAIYPNRHSNPTYTILGLVGEAGEVANKYKKILRDRGGILSEIDRYVLIDELGDVLWYLSASLQEVGSSLEVAATANRDKLAGRASRGTLRGSSDAR